MKIALIWCFVAIIVECRQPSEDEPHLDLSDGSSTSSRYDGARVVPETAETRSADAAPIFPERSRIQAFVAEIHRRGEEFLVLPEEEANAATCGSVPATVGFKLDVLWFDRRREQTVVDGSHSFAEYDENGIPLRSPDGKKGIVCVWNAWEETPGIPVAYEVCFYFLPLPYYAQI